MKIPTLVITDGTDEQPFGVGVPTLLDPDGRPLEWPTVDEWRITFSEEGFTTLSVSFPVRLRVILPTE